ncbi:MAG: NAD(P)-binding domain-containing protein [Bauldia sp.]|nr:NAD(P)-binding domain-containing protein [Bauldia sp.]
MDITIVGTGNMGRGIGTRLVAGGHNVTLVGRDLDKAEALAGTLRSGYPGARVTVAKPGEGLTNGLVVLALPYAAALDFARTNATALAGKTIVDITNPLNGSYDGLATDPGTSAAETLAVLLPDSRVVKAFNTTFAGTLVAGNVAGQPLDVFVAANDDAAKAAVLQLVADGGLRGIDAGKLERARQLEGLALLGITLQMPLGLGFQSAWRLVA